MLNEMKKEVYNKRTDIPNEVFSNKLTRLMNYFDISSQELSDCLNVNVSTIRSWKRGDSKPNSDNFNEILKHFNIKKSYFLVSMDNFINQLFLVGKLKNQEEIEINSEMKNILELANNLIEKDKEYDNIEDLLNEVIIEHEKLKNEIKQEKQEILELKTNILNKVEKKKEKINQKLKEMKKIKSEIKEETNKSLWQRIKGIFSKQKEKQSSIPVYDRKNN